MQSALIVENGQCMVAGHQTACLAVLIGLNDALSAGALYNQRVFMRKDLYDATTLPPILDIAADQPAQAVEEFGGKGQAASGRRFRIAGERIGYAVLKYILYSPVRRAQHTAERAM